MIRPWLLAGPSPGLSGGEAPAGRHKAPIPSVCPVRCPLVFVSFSSRGLAADGRSRAYAALLLLLAAAPQAAEAAPRDKHLRRQHYALLCRQRLPGLPAPPAPGAGAGRLITAPPWCLYTSMTARTARLLAGAFNELQRSGAQRRADPSSPPMRLQNRQDRRGRQYA